jgi:2,3-bisphosphoglycerate-independent phosphoglycerate mutase
MENLHTKKWLKPFEGPMLLCIVDGFGLRDEPEGNAVALAQTPVLDELYANNTHAQLMTHGAYVGLPDGQMGNSEVGHMTIGAGRTILQNLDLIRKSLSQDLSGSVNLQKALKVAEQGDKIHLIGLMSDGGVHSHTDHFVLLCEKLSVLDKPILVHAILDGRDTEPKVAQIQLEKFMSKVKHLNVHIVDMIGRFYAMDRDHNGDRLQKAYDLYTKRTGELCSSFAEAVDDQYEKGNVDEFVEPILFNCDDLDGTIAQKDTIFFVNFRADRMRQLVGAFLGENVTHFSGQENLTPQLVCMTEYDQKFNDRVITLFPATQPKMTLGEVVEKNMGKQLRIAESEKYAHVTFFLNGSREKSFENEDRIVIPSPKVKSYDLAPKMSLEKVKNELLGAIKKDYDLIVLNIANGDQVGHSGSLEAAIEAVEYIDECLGEVVQILQESKGEMVLIADHGNCEEMYSAQGGPMTAHTLNPVPILYVGRKGLKTQNGSLRDVAPTVLSLLGLPVPKEMTGKIIIQ